MITTIKATVVRSLFTDCIIGTDYIKKYDLKVDVGEETVTICKQKQRTTIPMVKQDQPLYVPFRLKQTTKIPPQQHVTVIVSACVSAARVLFRPSYNLKQQIPIFMANNLLLIKGHQAEIPIHNPASYPCFLKKGIILGVSTLPTTASRNRVVTDPQIAAAIPSFESLRSTLYRHKENKNQPPTPTSLRNLCIPDKYEKLCTGENFLQIQRYVVLATEHGLRLLFNATEVHVDGNFKVAPMSQAGGTPLFIQLFSFFGLFHNKILPLAFVFFNGKSKKKYSKLLRCLKDKAFALMMLFALDKIVLDFETGLVPAFQDEFPLPGITGCNFHFNQALYRNLQNLGLQQEYVDNEAVRKYFRMISGIPFPPTHLVQLTYDEVVDSTPLRRGHKMQPFYRYFSNMWLNGQYAVEVWNVYGQDRRANNDVESWYSKLSRLLQAQPTVWRLIETLHAQYVLVQHDTERLRAGT
ncbi:unnamed protein product [Didymodactylos carnosus]|uniref:MULE transposase domain-containing protein n=1 Tax=Didymodactylos carnosus TaxID=1234261 RepID=A0A814Y399_9BILA|nr:unnamed protein product [Didymodactylos carnosus]CAF3987210.1 unnamed protein product [Didymodactylos carnosus]